MPTSDILETLKELRGELSALTGEGSAEIGRALDEIARQMARGDVTREDVLARLARYPEVHRWLMQRLVLGAADLGHRSVHDRSHAPAWKRISGRSSGPGRDAGASRRRFPRLGVKTISVRDRRKDNHFLARMSSTRCLESRFVYRPLPGSGAAIGGREFVCPEQGCDTRWFRRSVGQRPPLCEKHHRRLVPKDRLD